MPPLSTPEEAPLMDFTDIQCHMISSSSSSCSSRMEPASPHSPSPKRVSFAKQNMIVHVMRRTAYSREEKVASWYCAEEYRLFRRNCRDIVEIMEQRSPIRLAQEFCFRGLEAKTIHGSLRRACNICEALHCVLDEQDCQDQDGVNNPEMLARIYRRQTLRCQVEAQERGLQDYNETLALEASN